MRSGFLAYVFFNCIFLNFFSVAKQSSIARLDHYLHDLKLMLDGLDSEKIEFSVQRSISSDQTFIRKGLLAIRPNAIGTVIVCHGYTHSKQEGFFFKMLFPMFNVLAFDFRGHGELVDKNQYSTIGRDEVFDVLGAVNFIKQDRRLKDKPIIGFGFSMGAVSLLQAQARCPDAFTALILDSPFDSSNDCMEQHIGKLLTVSIFGKVYQLPGKKILLNLLYRDSMRPLVKKFFKWASGMDPYKVPTRFVPVNPILEVEKITIPCFFISCVQDKSVAVSSVHRLYEHVHATFKRFWIAQGMKHCGTCLFQPENYEYKVNEFIQKVLKNDMRIPQEIQDDRIDIKAEIQLPIDRVIA